MRTFSRTTILILAAALVTSCDDGGSTASDMRAADSTAPDASIDLRAADTEPTEDLAVDTAQSQDVDAASFADARWVVIQRPYDDTGTAASGYEVLALLEDGTLSETGETFAMGRNAFGTIAFTANGAIGISAQEDGTLGIFRFDGDSPTPTVVHTNYDALVYADAVVIPEGVNDYAFVLDPNTIENGGGVTRIDLAPDGTPSNPSTVIAGSGIRGFAVANGLALFAAKDIAGAGADDDTFLLDLGTTTVISSVDLLPTDFIVSAAALMPDASGGLVADNCGFCADNGIGAVTIDGQNLAVDTSFTGLMDPAGIVASPFGNAALVAVAQDDAILHLSYDSAASPSFVNLGEPTYTGSGPALPVGMVVISSGPLMGEVLVAENTAVRQLRFDATGGVTDRGPFSFGSGLENIVGAIGVQP